MRIALYGGAFNPPHLGHVAVAKSALAMLKPDVLLILPGKAVHGKNSESSDLTPEQRISLCRAAFGDLPNTEICGMELEKDFSGYTADTVKQIRSIYPGAELTLIVGADKLEGLNGWYGSDYIRSQCRLAVAVRESEPARELLPEGSVLLDNERVNASSAEIRELLPKGEGNGFLPERVYSEIIRNRRYHALPNLDWLRRQAHAYLKPRRVAHVNGCEKTARELAEIYGEDQRKAVTAAILHDITKKNDYEEQLLLCRKYGMICDNDELNNPKLLHAKTGAYLARDLFGIEEEVFSAILWHTTGKPGMSRLEKIIYLADYVEPTRDFLGVERLRELVYKDLDAAMALGLSMSLEEVRASGVIPHRNTVEAYDYYKENTDGGYNGKADTYPETDRCDRGEGA